MAAGFEPATVCLEGRCSIQLSYATKSQAANISEKAGGFNSLEPLPQILAEKNSKGPISLGESVHNSLESLWRGPEVRLVHGK